MATLVKGLTLTKKRRSPEPTGKRVPEKDRPCPRCLAERNVVTMMFFYECTDSTGRSFTAEWCSWHHSEIAGKKK